MSLLFPQIFWTSFNAQKANEVLLKDMSFDAVWGGEASMDIHMMRLLWL